MLDLRRIDLERRFAGEGSEGLPGCAVHAAGVGGDAGAEPEVKGIRPGFVGGWINQKVLRREGRDPGEGAEDGSGVNFV